MARNYYEVGRPVLVKPQSGDAWITAVVTQSKPLRAKVTERHPVWHGAVLYPWRIRVMEKIVAQEA